MNTQRPRIGVPVDVKPMEDEAWHAAGEKYLTALAYSADAMPLLVPAIGSSAAPETGPSLSDAKEILDGLDGLFLTGSVTNLPPASYGEDGEGVGPFDPRRDDTTLPLLRAALARDMPVLTVCRGFQELNVVSGGTLFTAVHEQPGYMDHRDDHDLPREQRYAPAHVVNLAPGGFLAKLTGAREIQVNSLHGQGIARLGPELVSDATAPDGLVEAAYRPDHRFVVGVQWHPEWSVEQDTTSHRLFSAFGDAARSWQKQRAA